MATENMIKQSLSQFTVDFYDKIIAAQGDSLKNVFVSPLSIYTAMVMTMAGTDGKTRTEIESTLRIPKQLLATCPHKQIGTTVQKFFKPSEGVQLSLANRLFVIRPVPMVEQFKQILTKDYDASIEQICSLPSDEAKRQHINKWTWENTGQKITELLPTDAIDEDTVLALVNALYFKDNLKNVFVSPLSIYTAMVMTMAGTDGKTRTEIESTLRIPKQLLATCPHKQIGTTVQTFFKPSEGVQLSLANRLFVIKPVPMVEQFKQILDKDYNASIEQISSLPSNEAKREHINKWTWENTGQKITELLPTDAIDEDTVLALVNALYFKGMWKNRFNEVDTIRGDFTCFGGEKMDIMMMHVKAYLPYVKLTDWSAQAVRLPFKGTDWQMLVVLPLDASGLPNVLGHLRKPGALQDLLKKSFYETELDLFLPRFKLSHCEPVNVKALLKQCGINTIFDAGAADLTKLCSSEKLYVSNVFHKAILEVSIQIGYIHSRNGCGFLECARPNSVMLCSPASGLFENEDTDCCLLSDLSVLQ
ncbi:hypothetical protein P879_11981 [Paragonimus westermani]|uniref:Serpin domain-containing protein n=1 Tax=Paragonimus westermani TaxID=34504 RepID=A0A8T0D9H0_9TREM|nr:hypothetical protein P879_11981 [Paragonimus westermani]